MVKPSILHLVIAASALFSARALPVQVSSNIPTIDKSVAGPTKELKIEANAAVPKVVTIKRNVLSEVDAKLSPVEELIAKIVKGIKIDLAVAGHNAHVDTRGKLLGEIESLEKIVAVLIKKLKLDTELKSSSSALAKELVSDVLRKINVDAKTADHTLKLERRNSLGKHEAIVDLAEKIVRGAIKHINIEAKLTGQDLQIGRRDSLPDSEIATVKQLVSEVIQKLSVDSQVANHNVQMKRNGSLLDQDGITTLVENLLEGVLSGTKAEAKTASQKIQVGRRSTLSNIDAEVNPTGKATTKEAKGHEVGSNLVGQKLNAKEQETLLGVNKHINAVDGTQVKVSNVISLGISGQQA
ncbi:uncharacterized protein VTP21DRAFT_6942 [Calcarisporiella thermophila]|uniref:uncharacterized protein n=1 Tax=Calcarisporiella thermophila TaxID=911321 RepID=UPI0037443343